MQKIVIAVDSFKDSLTSSQVADTIEKALRDADSELNIVKMPISDGGEGLTDVLVNALGGRFHIIDTVDPLMRPIKVKFGSVENTAIIEMATAAGLELLKPEERNPMHTTTWGVGLMMQAALDLGYKKMLIGLGGSATNDAGLGAMQALGLRCYNSQGRIMKNGITGKDLADLAHIDLFTLKRKFQDIEIKVACDVHNPFFGPQGAACVYAAQKGASPEEVQLLDAGLRHTSHVWRRSGGMIIDNVQGAGAAGGFGGTLSTLLNAKVSTGIECVLDLLHFNEQIEETDLLITGEGSIDAQSFMGKALSGILRRANQFHIPVLAVAGRILDRDALIRAGVSDCIEITPRNMSIEEAIVPETAKTNLYNAVNNWYKFGR